MLELGKLADGRLAGLREQAERAAAGYSLVSCTGPVPDDFIERAAALYAALSDAPHDAGEAPEVWDAQRVRELNDRRPHYGTRDYSVAAVKGGQATGKLAALTEVVLDPTDAGWGHQVITAVTRHHRGHRGRAAAAGTDGDLERGRAGWVARPQHGRGGAHARGQRRLHLRRCGLAERVGQVTGTAGRALHMLADRVQRDDRDEEQREPPAPGAAPVLPVPARSGGSGRCPARASGRTRAGQR